MARRMLTTLVGLERLENALSGIPGIAQLRSKFVDVENCLDRGNHLDGFYQSAVMAQDEIDSAKYNPVENEKLR